MKNDGGRGQGRSSGFMFELDCCITGVIAVLGVNLVPLAGGSSSGWRQLIRSSLWCSLQAVERYLVCVSVCYHVGSVRPWLSVLSSYAAVVLSTGFTNE